MSGYLERPHTSSESHAYSSSILRSVLDINSESRDFPDLLLHDYLKNSLNSLFTFASQTRPQKQPRSSPSESTLLLSPDFLERYFASGGDMDAALAEEVPDNVCATLLSPARSWLTREDRLGEIPYARDVVVSPGWMFCGGYRPGCAPRVDFWNLRGFGREIIPSCKCTPTRLLDVT